MAQASKYPGENTVAIRVPTRLMHCLENQVIPYLLSQPHGGVMDDVLIINLSLLHEYVVRKDGCYLRKHIYEYGAIIPYNSREVFQNRLRNLGTAYSQNPNQTGGQKAEELIG